MKNKVLKTQWLKEDVTVDHTMQPIEVFEEMIIKFKTLGATHIDSEVDKDWHGTVDSINYLPYKIFTETDEEVEIREKKEKQESLKREEAANTRLKNHELLELKRLKEKYEN